MDGLCGAYAAINAVRLLVPKSSLKDPFERELVHVFMSRLAERVAETNRNLVNVMFGREYGTVLKDLKAGLEGVVERVRDAPFGTQISFRELPRVTMSLDDYWGHLSQHLKPGPRRTSVAIVGMRKPDDHWTVVSRVGPKTIRFFDSAGRLWSARRSQCTLSTPSSGGRHGRTHAFRPKETLLLSSEQ